MENSVEITIAFVSDAEPEEIDALMRRWPERVRQLIDGLTAAKDFAGASRPGQPSGTLEARMRHVQAQSRLAAVVRHLAASDTTLPEEPAAPLADVDAEKYAQVVEPVWAVWRTAEGVVPVDSALDSVGMHFAHDMHHAQVYATVVLLALNKFVNEALGGPRAASAGGVDDVPQDEGQ